MLFTTGNCQCQLVIGCLQELLAIQQSDGPKNLGFFGTRNMGMTHQKLVEILGYAMVSAVSIYSSMKLAVAVPTLLVTVCTSLSRQAHQH
jgi:hypothetical protein